MRKQAAFNNINGMNQDVSISKFNPKMIYEGMNIRINSSEDGTLFSITNEKGNKKCIIWNFDRTQTVELNYVVGHCVLNDWLVIFDTTFQSSPNSPQGGTGDEPRVDRILRLEGINDYEFTAYVLYESDGSDTGLNFRASELIECFGLYESDDNQKVYFCDRNNPIRFINIMKDVTEVDSNGQLVYDSDRVRNNLNFCPVLKLEETYDIQKRNYGGTFHSGVIQYAFSYWNLNGQETHIHYVTPLYYISFEDRAGSPEQTCSNSFRIEIDHLDSNFDYLRIYCIHRTTEDAMPNARIVSDIYLRDEDDNPLTFADIIDDGIIGRTFDSNLLPVLGGDEIFAETMATKEGVLFAGNIRMFNENLEAVKDIIRNNDPDNPVFRVEIIRSGEEKDAQGNNLFEDVEIFNEDIKNPQNDYYMYYPYTLNKPSDTVKHWKFKETYRLGLQFQHENGLWSSSVFLSDIVIDKPMSVWGKNDSVTGRLIGSIIRYNRIKVELTQTLLNAIPAFYKKVRLVYVKMTPDMRTVITQGILMNTLYRNGARESNSPFAVPDWYIRPNRELCINYAYNTSNIGDILDPSVEPALPIISTSALLNMMYSKWLGTTNIFSQNLYPLPSLHGMPTALRDSMGYPLLYMSNSETWQSKMFTWPSMPAIDIKTRLRNSTEISKFFQYTGSADTSNDIIYYNNSYYTNDYLRHDPWYSNFNIRYSSLEYETYRGGFNATGGIEYHNEHSLEKDTDWVIDKGIINMFSPEIMYDPNFANIDLSNTGLRFRMAAMITHQSWNQKANVNGSPGLESFLSWLIMRRNEPYKSFNYSYNQSSMPLADYFPKRIYRIFTDGTDIIERSEEATYSALWHAQNSYTVNTNLDPSVPGAVCNSQDTSLWYSSAFAMTLYRKESVIDWGNNRITAENISPEISIYTPKYMGLTDDKYIVYKGSDIHKRPFNYGREVFEIISTMSDNGTHGEGDNPVMVYPVKYRTNNHLVMELKYMARPKDKLVRDHVILPEFASKSETTYPVYMEYIDKKEDTLHTSIIQPEYYFQNPDNSNKEVTMDDIQGSIMELDLANYPENNGHWILKSGYPYVWIADLVRTNETNPDGTFNTYNQYGNNTEENLMNHLWIPAGEKRDIGDMDVNTGVLTLFGSEGDTFIQRFDLLKTAPFDTDSEGTEENNSDWNKLWVGISVWIESFINMDGRYDNKRGMTNLYDTKFETFTALNPVYSQKNNFFEYNTLNTNLLNDYEAKSTFAWSSPKTVNELIDSWTSMYLTNSHTVLSDYGNINKLINFNNEIIGFQDKNIFRVLYNSRVQVPASDGLPIELMQGVKVPEVNYINSLSGTTNKWSVLNTETGLWFMDTHNRSINVLSQDYTDITEQLGMSSWAKRNISDLLKYSPAINDSYMGHYDQIRGDIYYSSSRNSLSFSERLKQYESFFSYENVIGGTNYRNRYYMLAPSNEKTSTDLWLHHGGKTGEYFGEVKDSYIEYYVNPEYPFDKVFDNISYRGDVFDTTGDYLPKETFEKMIVSNEFQTGERLLKGVTGTSDWRAKKYRIWEFAFPRQISSLNRIRNPWVKLKLLFNNEHGYSFVLHDLVVKYSV